MRKYRCVAEVGTLLATVTMTKPAAQAAEEPVWEYVEGHALAHAEWVRPAHIVGRPGNMHSGYFTFEESDDGVTAELLDWKCTTGVTPPTQVGPATSCVLKGSLWVQQPQFAGTYHFGDHLVRNEIQITVPVEDFVTGTTVDQALDIRMQGLDPEEEAVSYFTSEAAGLRFRYKQVDRKRAAVFSGS